MTKDKLKELKEAERKMDEAVRVAESFNDFILDNDVTDYKGAVFYALGDAENMDQAHFEPDDATWKKLHDILADAINAKCAEVKVAFECL